MFEKAQIEGLFAELDRNWRGTPEFDQFSRDAHLGIALCDSGRPFQEKIDSRIAALIEKYKPKE